MALFQIEIIGGKDKYVSVSGAPACYSTGGEAKAEADTLNEKAKLEGAPWRYRVSRHEDTSDPVNVLWREDVVKKFETGKYKKPPWHSNYDVVNFGNQGSYNSIKDHYAHLSTTEPGFIAYYPSSERGSAGRPERISAGRYLTKFFPQIGAEATRYWAGLCQAFSEEVEVRFAYTPEEIALIYRAGPGSCMSKAGRSYGINEVFVPVMAYGAGDLAIAYRVGKNGGVTARCVCYPARKSFGRIYPEDGGSAATDLKRRLEAEGWKHFGKDQLGLYDGAHLLRRVSTRRAHGAHDIDNLFFILPHLDHANWVDFDGENFKIMPQDDGGIYARDAGHGIAYGFKCEERGCHRHSSSAANGSWLMPVSGDRKRLCTHCIKKKDVKACGGCGSLRPNEGFVVYNGGNLCSICVLRLKIAPCAWCAKLALGSESAVVTCVEGRVCNACLANPQTSIQFCYRCAKYKRTGTSCPICV